MAKIFGFTLTNAPTRKELLEHAETLRTRSFSRLLNIMALEPDNYTRTNGVSLIKQSDYRRR